MSVFVSALSLFGYSLQASWSWISRIFVASGAMGWWFGVFFTYTVFRFFIFPLVGSAGSDKAGKSKKGVDDE